MLLVHLQQSCHLFNFHKLTEYVCLVHMKELLLISTGFTRSADTTLHLCSLVALRCSVQVDALTVAKLRLE